MNLQTNLPSADFVVGFAGVVFALVSDCCKIPRLANLAASAGGKGILDQRNELYITFPIFSYLRVTTEKFCPNIDYMLSAICKRCLCTLIGGRQIKV